MGAPKAVKVHGWPAAWTFALLAALFAGALAALLRL
jgi:hypothetical protein